MICPLHVTCQEQALLALQVCSTRPLQGSFSLVKTHACALASQEHVEIALQAAIAVIAGQVT
ncbi:MAG: hypothetical protein ABI627_26695 [Polyangiaceae bacterium]